MMLVQTLIFLAGIALLYYGAEWLVGGAASLALRYGLRPLIVGLTVVALGTSMPEFVINLFAAVAGQDEIALGNIVGSNIANIALILGTSAVVLPLAVNPAMLRKEYPIMVVVMLVFYAQAMDGVISSWDGLVLVAGLVAFLTYVVMDARKQSREAALEGLSDVNRDDLADPLWKKALLIAGGMLLLGVGARMMIFSAVNMAQFMGISEIVIGLTIVAIGTSLPELATSMIGALNQEADLSIGNALGSNLLNVLFVVGFVSLIRPLQVAPASVNIHFPIMIGFAVLLLPLAWTQYRITRMEGGVLVAGFLGYMAYVVMVGG